MNEHDEDVSKLYEYLGIAPSITFEPYVPYGVMYKPHELVETGPVDSSPMAAFVCNLMTQARDAEFVWCTHENDGYLTQVIVSDDKVNWYKAYTVVHTADREYSTFVVNGITYRIYNREKR